MKKRLICLFLCLAMVLVPVLASCSNKDLDDATNAITDNASASAVTLSMWLVTESEVSDEVAVAISEAVNAITRSKFKTSLVMNFLTSDEYATRVTETIAAYEAANGTKVEKETTAASGEQTEAPTDETETNEWGMTTIKYPSLLENQVDIIYIDGEDMFIDYTNKDWLAALDNELAGPSKKINEFVSPTLMSAAKYNGVTYAVPNNNPIGEYTYMLLDRELMDKYHQQVYIYQNMITGFYNRYLYSFLNLVSKLETANYVPIQQSLKNSDGTVKFLSYDKCLELLAHYWSLDPATYTNLKDFSVFGYHYTEADELNRGSIMLGFNSLFTDPTFTADYLKLNEFYINNYFGETEGTAKKPALQFITGDANVLSKYNAQPAGLNESAYLADTKYYAIPVQYPSATPGDIYSNMFGVCKYSKSVSRSMEIITYLNTNADFRNLIQYGVKDVHYRVVENNGVATVQRLTENGVYNMDVFATGNAFIAYPEPNMDADVWEIGKAQNRVSVVDPLLGFNLGIIAETTGTAEQAPTLDSRKGYNFSYSTGYSKEIFEESQILSSWLAQCDAAGDGIYVLHSPVAVNAQNTNNIYYIYNNGGNVKFSAEAIPEYATSVDENGEEVQEQIGFDVALNYKNTSGTAEYELSIVSVYTKKATTYDMICNVDDSEAAFNMTENKTLGEFDIWNTKNYTVDAYESIKMIDIRKNTNLMEWIESLGDWEEIDGTFALTYTKDNGDDTVTRIYAVLHNGLKEVTDVEVLPIGTGDKLALTVNYTTREGAMLDSKTEADYLLSYVRVTTKKDAEVTLEAIKDGKSISVSRVTEATEDPNFTICGNLDTELVKYMYNLDQNIFAEIQKLLDDGDYDAFEQLVTELGMLLTIEEEVSLQQNKFSVLNVSVDEEEGSTVTFNGVTYDWDELHSSILAFTSRSDIKYEDDEDTDADESLWNNPINGRKEEYGLYKTPYGIYYQWLDSYGYMPEDD